MIDPGHLNLYKFWVIKSKDGEQILGSVILGVKRPQTNFQMFVDFFTGLKTTSDGKTYNYTNCILRENDEFSLEI